MKFIKPILYWFIAVASVALLISSCQKHDVLPTAEDNSLQRKAKKWYAANSNKSDQSSDLNLNAFEVDWSKAKIGFNVNGDSVVSVALFNKKSNNDYFYEFNAVQNESGSIFGLVKEYLGDPYGAEEILLRFYSVSGSFQKIALYSPQKGTMRYIKLKSKGGDLLTRMGEKIACTDCVGNMEDGYEIEEVEVTGYVNNDEENPDDEDRYEPEIPSGPEGGGSSGLPPPPNPKQDPCSHSEKMKKDTKLKNKLKDLKKHADDKNKKTEKGFTYTNDANGNFKAEGTTFEGKANEPNVSFNVNGKIDGFAHTHYQGLLPVFSYSDLYAIAQLYNGNHINNLSTFSAVLITNSGTVYNLKIENEAKFKAWAGTLKGGNVESTDYLVNYFEKMFPLKPSQSTGVNESNLLRLLDVWNTGMSLFKGNKDFSDWKRRKVNSSNTAVNDPCKK